MPKYFQSRQDVRLLHAGVFQMSKPVMGAMGAKLN